MGANKFKEEEKKRRKSPFKKATEIDFNLKRENAHKWLPFILFLGFWAIIYMANRHASEKAEMNINDLNRELKDLRAEYLTLKSELMFKSKQSEVAERVEDIGLQELTEPPHKIIMSEDE